VRAILLPVGSFLRSIKDIIGAHIEQSGADFRTSPGHISGAANIDLLGFLRVHFATVNVGVGSKMKDQFRPQLAKSFLNRRFLADIKVLEIHPSHLVLGLETG
jgi:hypothetical protein